MHTFVCTKLHSKPYSRHVSYTFNCTNKSKLISLRGFYIGSCIQIKDLKSYSSVMNIGLSTQ